AAPRRDAAPGVRALPPPPGAPAPGRGHALGRRAADVRDRARADVVPAAPAPRRAEPGAVAGDGEDDLRAAGAHQPGRHHRPARRAERPPRPRAIDARLRPRERSHHPRRHAREPDGQPPHPPGLPRDLVLISKPRRRACRPRRFGTRNEAVVTRGEVSSETLHGGGWPTASVILNTSRDTSGPW